MRRILPVAIGVTLLLLWAQWLRGGIVDDAYIFCRYAHNLAAGQGAVFNPGERVEGTTSPALLGLLGLCARFRADLPLAAVLISMMAAVAALLFLRGEAALLAAAVAPLGAWATTGMDVTLFALAVAGVTFLVEREPDAPRPGVWIAAGAAYWVRPEGLLLWLALLVRHRASWRRALLGLAPIAILTAARLVYYGVPLPNTFYAKAAGGPLLWWRGLRYLGSIAIVLLPLVLAVLLARPRRWGFAGVALALLALGIVFEGGDHFAMVRFAVPLVPLLAVLAARGLAERFGGLRLGIAAAGMAVVTASWTALIPQAERIRFANEVGNTALFDRVGRALATALGPRHRLAIVTAGAIPFRTEWETIDMLGLCDAHIARAPRTLGRGIIGHERFDSRYVIDRAPDVILLHPWFWQSPVPNPETRLSHEAQLDLLREPRFAERYRLEWLQVPDGFIALYRAAASPH